ncbi:MAG TPA: primosomal protein N' [Thauera sp.]|nr:primosomal protein N' [Thauera sp.]
MRLIHGRSPRGLEGVLFRNGPGWFRYRGSATGHWFDGDGFIQRFAIADGRARHSARFADTNKRRIETARQQIVMPGFGTRGQPSAPVNNADSLNAANTSVMMAGAELWALWEGGSPTQLDPATLQTVGLRTLRPEIALTPQLEQRVAQRFAAANVVSLHSALADGARSRGFVQALTGRADIVLGTRLAVFAPLPRLGLILVDEEHDASYKQQEGVRYSARDVAVWRARQRGVPIVLGSATPSLETWYHARSERYALQTLSQRAVAATLPAVHCIDTRRLKLDEGLSPGLQAAIGQRLERGEQSLVFLNRRGYAPVLSCPSCGWVSRCPHCSANLVVHLADRRLRCHHCGCDGSIPHACPSCGNQDIQPFGRGTQRIEARLAERFPQARVLRVDRDAARTRAQWEKLLDTIAAGEADILVGTQMMAKGHDFPRLTLVGVIGADASLHAADFRAPERLFQQLMQVGGRAGRGTLPGTVLIQTEYPGHPLYQHLGRHDFDAFARMALQERRSAGFPPFTHQAMLRADAPALDDAVEFLRHARRLAEALAPEGLRLYDPVPMRMTRLARRERAQLLIEADQRGLLQAFLLSWIEMLYRQRTARELRWQIDVDPLEV